MFLCLLSLYYIIYYPKLLVIGSLLIKAISIDSLLLVGCLQLIFQPLKDGSQNLNIFLFISMVTIDYRLYTTIIFLKQQILK